MPAPAEEKRYLPPDLKAPGAGVSGWSPKSRSVKQNEVRSRILIEVFDHDIGKRDPRSGTRPLCWIEPFKCPAQVSEYSRCFTGIVECLDRGHRQLAVFGSGHGGRYHSGMGDEDINQSVAIQVARRTAAGARGVLSTLPARDVLLQSLGGEVGKVESGASQLVELRSGVPEKARFWCIVEKKPVPAHAVDEQDVLKAVSIEVSDTGVLGVAVCDPASCAVYIGFLDPAQGLGSDINQACRGGCKNLLGRVALGAPITIDRALAYDDAIRLAAGIAMRAVKSDGFCARERAVSMKRDSVESTIPEDWSSCVGG